MLVVVKSRGRWNGRKYVFDANRVFKIHRGSLAYAKGGGGGTTQEFVPTGPWSGQIPYIQNLFQGAQGFLEQGPPQYYPDNTVAPTNPNLAASQQQIQNTTGGMTNLLGGVMGQSARNQQTPTLAGQVGAQQQQPFNAAVGGLVGQGFNNPTQGVAQASLPAFFSGVGNAAFQNPNQITAAQTQFGNVNANPALMSSLYSNGLNPYTGQIVNAALRSQNQQFAQNVLPQISSQANLAGQIGGTRQGIAEGIAGQNQANLQGDLIARLFGQAFDVGSQERLAALGLVGQGQQANQQAAMQAQQLQEAQRAGRTAEGLQASQLVGQMLQGGQGLGQQALTSAGQLSGNMLTQGSAQNLQSQVQNAALMPGLTQAINASLGMGNQAALQQQAQDQATRDAAVERWFFEQFAPYNLLTQYQNWITGPYGASRDSAGYGSNFGNWFNNQDWQNKLNFG